MLANVGFIVKRLPVDVKRSWDCDGRKSLWGSHFMTHPGHGGCMPRYGRVKPSGGSNQAPDGRDMHRANDKRVPTGQMVLDICLYICKYYIYIIILFRYIEIDLDIDVCVCVCIQYCISTCM